MEFPFRGSASLRIHGIWYEGSGTLGFHLLTAFPSLSVFVERIGRDTFTSKYEQGRNRTLNHYTYVFNQSFGP